MWSKKLSYQYKPSVNASTIKRVGTRRYYTFELSPNPITSPDRVRQETVSTRRARAAARVCLLHWRFRRPSLH